MKILVTGRRLLAGMAAFGAAGLMVVWSGVIDVGASSGHWRLTYQTLHWAMQNSTRTHSLFEPEPPADLDSSVAIRRAAGHFETACAFCHGSPLHERPRLAAHMTPMPPGLGDAAGKWTPRELARIVRHGVKYTGMPSWIAPGRDDEVWAMVAFLRALPAMTPGDYRRATVGPAVAEDRVLEGCARCHGVDGRSSDGAFPVIGGQSEAYLVETLQAFAKGARASGFMQFAIDGLSDDDLVGMARHYAGQQGLNEAVPPNDAPGAAIARDGLPQLDVPPCESCHGASARRNPAYPRLAGQDAGYLAGQLRLMKWQARGGTGYGPVMQRIAERLPEAAIDAVAAYYSARRVGGTGGP